MSTRSPLAALAGPIALVTGGLLGPLTGGYGEYLAA